MTNIRFETSDAKPIIGKKAQLERVYEAFRAKPMTMLEADRTTGVMRSNICWYLGHLLDIGEIAVRKKRKCSITGRLVKEFTGNPNLFPKSIQLKLFPA